MNAKLLDGKMVAQDIRKEVSEGVQSLKKSMNIIPKLTVILVGDHPASQIYVRTKEKASLKIGMHSEIIRLSKDISMDHLLGTIDKLNKEEAVHGILVQLPLPEHLDEHKAIQAIDPEKDVDGFHPINVGRLTVGIEGFLPCTPAGIIELLKRYDIDFAGKNAVVIGRSNIVGKPMSLLLLREHATVTICHSRTRNLANVASGADILVVAMGRKAMVTADYIKEGAIVVDVGMHRITEEEEVKNLFQGDQERLKTFREKGSTLVGDTHPSQVSQKAGYWTPVPGGVGPLTVAMLLKNTLRAAKLQSGRLP